MQSDLATLVGRLDAVEARLAAAALADPPPGTTDPDPGEVERWEAGQIWAHIAEFVPYWAAQARAVLAAASESGEPPPFGRLKTDPGRIAAIERERNTAPADLMARVHAGLAEVRALLAGLTPESAAREGMHPVRGPMSVATILTRFVVDHLEEHATSLEQLAAAVEGPAD